MSWQSTPPVGVRLVSSQTIGSGGNVVLIHQADNIIGIQLISLDINSGAVSPPGGGGSGFLVQDVVLDGNGVQYGACNIGLAQGAAGQAFNDAGFDLDGIVLPPAVNLKLFNGGAGGTGSLRQCSATVVYIVLTD